MQIEGLFQVILLQLVCHKDLRLWPSWMLVKNRGVVVQCK